MSDAGSDSDGPPIAGFLFGNLDENNKLDADYLDAEELSQLQSLGGTKLGLSDQIKGLQDGVKSTKGQKAAADQEVQKAEDAVNYSDEEELLDYSPKADEAPTPEWKAYGQKAKAGPSQVKSTAANAVEVKLPILAKHGDITLLRFSELFGEPIKPERAETRRVKRRIEPAPEPEESTQWQAIEYDSDSGMSAQTDSLSEQDTAAVDRSSGPGRAISESPRGGEAGQAQEDARRKGDKSLRRGMLRLDSSHFHGVQLADWEDNICWDESPAQEQPDVSERDSDEEVAPPVANGGEGDCDMDNSEMMGDILGPLRTRTKSAEHTQLLRSQENQWLAEADWEEDVRWDDSHSPLGSPVAPDMNDPHLIFQLLRTAEDDESHKAAALVLDPMPKVKIASGPVIGKGKIYTMLARHNLSQDEDYAKKKAKKALQSMKYRHSLPALQLATLPPKPSQWELWHRPRGLWLPLSSKPRAPAKEGDKSTVKILSLIGPAKHAPNRIFKAVDLFMTPLDSLWNVMKGGAKFTDCKDLGPTQVEFWYRGAQPHAVPRNLPIAQTGIPLDANMELSLVVSGVKLTRTAVVDNIPESVMTTPIPVAIQKTKQLTANDGHLVLLEYLEEAPLLLSRPGMAVRLATYYRNKTENEKLPTELTTGPKWERGAVESLSPTEDSPFSLGEVPAGVSQLVLECSMYRAPAKAHPTTPADFLLIRAASGALHLREITGTVMVGQQEPLRRIPAPNSKECKELQEARMVAYVMRELRRQKFRNEKKEKSGRQVDAIITVKELADLFPTMSESVIRSRLRDRCNCVPLKEDNAGTFKLADGVTIADERELRQLIKPEEWCAHERMELGVIDLHQRGVQKQDRLSALSFEKFKMAAEQLSPPEAYSTVLHELEAAVQMAPWTLTDNFISAMREGRGALALTGAGDPTARGEGFSYFKEPPRAPVDKTVDAATTIPRDGNITGTNNDLRRLTMTESKAVLLKLGLDEASIKDLSRWQRIAAVRDLSTAAAGEEEGEIGKLGNKYARVARASVEEQQRVRRLQARQIFARQLEAIAGEGIDSDTDDDSWGDELEKELAGGEDEAPAGNKRGQEDEDELDDVEELRKSGFLTGEAASKVAKGKPKLEAKAGDVRIKRTIKFRDNDGEVQTRVIYYTDKDKKNTLNDFYRRDGRDPNLGFGKRVVSGGGTWVDLTENPNPNARKTKKNMALIQCKACGMMGHYKSNKICPLYAQTHASAIKAKEEKLAAPDSPLSPLPKLTLVPNSSMSPSDRGKSLDGDLSLKRLRSDLQGHGSPTSRQNPKKLLGMRVLCKALAQTKKAVPEGVWVPFKSAVTKASAPDYNDFVPASEEMHLDKIERKAKHGSYNSTSDFLADFERIVENARVYNKPGNGRYGGPAIVTWAEQLLEGVRNQLSTEHLQKMAVEIETFMSTDLGSAPAVLPAEPPQDAGPGRNANLWVQCTNCQKWRKISQKVNDETVPTSNEAPWLCSWDYERPGASCDNPEDQDL